MSVLRRLWREERALAPIIETVIMMMLVMGFFGGFSAYVLGAQARSVVIAAADTAGRTASIECGLGDASWQADAQTAAQAALVDGGLSPSDSAGSAQPGYWSATISATGGCPGGSQVTATVQYNQRNVFPLVGPLLGAGPADATVLPLQSSVVFPVD